MIILNSPAEVRTMAAADGIILKHIVAITRNGHRILT
jgi:hypothetical protein